MRTVAVVVAAALLAACGALQAPKDVVRPVQLAQVAIGTNATAAVFAGAVAPRHEAELGVR